MKRSIISLATLAVFLVIGGSARAGQISGLTTFTNGTTAVASEVTGNFTAVETAVNDNDSRISALEATSADVTGVTAGSGLTGGGTSGNVTLSIGTDGVTSTHIKDDEITNSDINSSANIASSKLLDGPGLKYTKFTSSPALPTDKSYYSPGSVSIVAPGPGYIKVEYTGNVFQIGNSSYAQVGIGLDATSFYETSSWEYVGYNGALVDDTATILIPFHTMLVYQVTSAGTYTFYANATETSGSATIYLYSRYLVATFYPTLY